jgi:magnesium-transporting ATPase (P-type)
LQDELAELIKNPRSNQKRFDDVREVMRHLSLCHTIMINPDSKELIWQSPDEFELVVQVGKWHMDFSGRDS